MTYCYDSSDRLIKSSDGMEYFYDHNGVAGFKYNNATYIYQKDIQGNIIAILDSTGAVVVKYVYDAWGNHKVYNAEGTQIAISGRLGARPAAPTHIGSINPFRYRGYFYDYETGLYYLKSRYYDPEIGRFINMDSVAYADPENINGLNLYAYCRNNPVMYVDPKGTFAISISIAVAALVALFAVSLIEVTMHPIQNAAEELGDAIETLIDSIDVSVNVNYNSSDIIESTYISESISQIAINPIEIVYAKQKYRPKRRGVRVKGKSKKDAEEKARRRGGGKKPVFHKGGYNPKLGKWIGPHFHPGVPEGHPFFHDHYFFSLLFMLFLADYDEWE